MYIHTKGRGNKMPKVTQKEDITRIWAMGSVCISDLPEGSVYTSPTNGKQYLNITIQNLPDIKVFGRNGFTHEVKTGSKDNSRTIGNLTEYKKEVSPETKSNPEPPNESLKPAKEEKPKYSTGEVDSLPF